MLKELKNKLKVSDDALGRVMEWKRPPSRPPHWVVRGPKKLAKLLLDQDDCRIKDQGDKKEHGGWGQGKEGDYRGGRATFRYQLLSRLPRRR